MNFTSRKRRDGARVYRVVFDVGELHTPATDIMDRIEYTIYEMEGTISGRLKALGVLAESIERTQKEADAVRSV